MPGSAWGQEKAGSGRAGILSLSDKRPARNAQQYFSRGRQVVATSIRGVQGKIDEYSLVNSSGKRTLHLKNVRHSSILRPSPAGDYAVGWTGQDGPPVGPIFYNGKEEKKAESWPERAYVTGVVFSSKGDRVAVFGGGGTFLYRRNGSKIAELPASRGVAFSSSDKFIAVTGDGVLHVYAADGQKKGQAPVPGLSSTTNLVRVSDDGTHAVYALNSGEVGAVDVSRGTVEWRWNTTSLPTITADVKVNLNGLDATPDLRKIVATMLSYRMVQVDLPGGNKGTDPEHINDHMVLLDAQGRLLDDISLPPNGFIPTDNNAVTPEISQNGKQLQIERKSESLVYSIK
jgi:hypothetical protein